MGNLLDALWASTLESIQIDLAQRAVTISAHALDAGETTSFRLECLGVGAFSYVDPEPPSEAWDYAEITSAELRERDDGQLEIAMCFWLEEREFTLLCEDVRFEAVS
jgi:hypothetical protein